MSQRWNVANYEKFGNFVPKHGEQLIELLKPQRRERILDVGCGDGRLTEKIIALGCTVVGIDPSPTMLEVARSRGIDAREADVRHLTFDNEFDGAFSNAALHWVKEQDLAVASVARALKVGGRFACELGGKDNIRFVQDALMKVADKHGKDGKALNPWFYPGVEEYRPILERNGFKIGYITLFARPTPLPEGMAGWIRTFGVAFLNAFPENERESFINEVVEELRPNLCDKQGNWHADHTRLRYLAIKK